MSRRKNKTLFYPQDAQIPSVLRTAEFILRPLRATDVKLDYDAVMTSKEMLRVWEQSDWPADDFTLADNLKDLQMHEKKHLERTAFTFTVMNPTETECLGCVYLYSLEGMLKYMKAGEDELATVSDYKASASFWVRQSRLADSLDQRLLDALIAWFKRDWAFSRVVFNTNSQDERQVRLLTEAGLQELYVFDMPDKKARYLIYG